MANDAESILRILISLGVMGKEDVEAAKKLLEETGESGKKAMDEMNQSMPENLEGWKNFKGHVQEASESTHELHEELHGISGAARAAGLGELGHLAHEALNPVALLLSGMVIALQQYYEWQERIEERHKEMIKGLQAVNDFYREIINKGETDEEMWVERLKTVADYRAQIQGLGADLKRVQEESAQFDIYNADQLARQIDGQQRKLDLLEQEAKLLEQMRVITPEKAAEVALQEEHQKAISAINAEGAKKRQELVSARTDRDNYVNTIPGGLGAVTPDAIGKAEGIVQGLTEKVQRATDMADDKVFTEQVKKQQEIIDAQNKRMANDPFGAEDPDALAGITEAQDNIAKLRRHNAEAHANLTALQEGLSAAQEQLKTLQGVHDTVQGMDAKIKTLGQEYTDARAAAAQKAAAENREYAVKLAQTVLQTTGLSPEDIVSQGTAAGADLQQLRAQGFDANRIQREGAAAENAKRGGQAFDQNAIDRLNEFKNDRTLIDRFNAVFGAVTEHQETVGRVLEYQYAIGSSLAVRIQVMENLYSTLAKSLAVHVTTGTS